MHKYKVTLPLLILMFARNFSVLGQEPLKNREPSEPDWVRAIDAWSAMESSVSLFKSQQGITKAEVEVVEPDPRSPNLVVGSRVDWSRSLETSPPASQNKANLTLDSKVKGSFTDWGAQEFKRDRFEILLTKQNIELMQIQLQAHYDTFSKWLEFLKSRTEWESEKTRLSLAERASGLAQKQFEKGLISRQERDQSLTEFEYAKLRVKEKNSLVSSLTLKLQKSAGLSPNEFLEWPWRRKLLSLNENSLNLALILKSLPPLSQRPSLQVFLFDRQMLDKQFQAIQSGKKPNLGWNVGLSQSVPLQSASGGTPRPVFSLGLGAEWPVNQSFQETSQERVILERKKHLQLSADLNLKDAEQNDIHLLNNLLAELDSIAFHQKLIKWRERDWKEVLKRFELGRTTLPQLIQEEKRYSDSVKALQDLGYELHVTLAKVCRLRELALTQCHEWVQSL